MKQLSPQDDHHAINPHCRLVGRYRWRSSGTPPDFEKLFATQAKQENPAFVGFSAEQGQRFYARTHGKDWSCASCHDRTPVAIGQHVATGKTLAPLAPAANPERFTRPDKVEKWFKRNCNEVLGRPCTAQEKGDVLAYLLTVR